MLLDMRPDVSITFLNKSIANRSQLDIQIEMQIDIEKPSWSSGRDHVPRIENNMLCWVFHEKRFTEIDIHKLVYWSKTHVGFVNNLQIEKTARYI